MGNRYIPVGSDFNSQRDRIERAHGCLGKLAYPSKKVARGILRVMRQKYGPCESLNAYACRICKRWHLGNTRPPYRVEL